MILPTSLVFAAPQHSIFDSLKKIVEAPASLLGGLVTKATGVDSTMEQIGKNIERAGQETRKTAVVVGSETQKVLRVAGQEAEQVAERIGKETEEVIIVASNETQQIIRVAGDKTESVIRTAAIMRRRCLKRIRYLSTIFCWWTPWQFALLPQRRMRYTKRR